MIDIPTAVALCAVFGGLGVLGGIVLHYWGEYKPLMERYFKLVHTLTYMKKQGFVPQYDIEQPKSIDVSEDVNEI